MKPALLLIDLQQDYLAADGLAPSAGAVCAGAVRLLGACRAAGVPVVHVWTTIRDDAERMPHWRQEGRRRCVEGTPGHATPESLRPAAGELIIHKRFFSAFTEEALEGYLRREGVDTVILAGVHLRACVRTTALDAYQRDLAVWIAADAVGDDDPIHGALTRQYLSARGIAFPEVAEILRSLTAAEPPSVATEVTHVAPGTPRTPLWRFPSSDRRQVAEAAAAARAAASQWAGTSYRERVALLVRLAVSIEVREDEFSRQIAVETGKPIRQARGEVGYALGLVGAAIRYAAVGAVADRGEGWIARRRPQGVIAAITPWNNPLAIPLGKLAPALLFGNTVVWKPAIPGAGIAQQVFALLRESGCPEGVVTLVNGDHTTAEHLIAEPAVDAVALTGSSAAGFAAQTICARRRIPLQAELGGNNGAIVWGDADLESAARFLARGAFGAAGQRCTASRRLIVDAACYGEFVDRFTAEARLLAWGDPLDEATEIGPVISRASLERIEALVERARAAGAEVRHLQPPGAHSGDPAGWYFPPTLVLCDDPGAEIVQEETFGPVAVIQCAGSWPEALERCNGVRQGLIASLFSRSVDRQQEFLAGAQAGMLKLNVPPDGAAPDAPFCAWRESGQGPPEHGTADRDFYSKYQTVYQADQVPQGE